MEKWEHKSLEWLHKVRQDDYPAAKDMSAKELIEKTRNATMDFVKNIEAKRRQRLNRGGR
jgi:hypothetical protein